VDELVAWLRQQIDEDERAWQMVAARDVVELLHGEPLAPRMLAEVTAKRAILDWCSERERIYVGTVATDVPRPEDFVDGQLKRPADAVVIRLLAQPFAGRPGWREEWAT
jgi:hypothetical protein